MNDKAPADAKPEITQDPYYIRLRARREELLRQAAELNARLDETALAMGDYHRDFERRHK